MTPERWREVEAVLDAALDLPVQERSTYVAAACTGDHELRTEVEKLLAAVDAPAALVPDEPAAQFAAPVLARITTEGGGLGPPPRPSQAMRTPMPERIGPYRVIADAGEGGMGVVYIAERDDGTYAKRVALKVVRRGLHLDARFNRRFQEERQILARLDHTNIARLLDGGVTDDGLPYFVMEYVEGEPIDRWCDARRLSIEERLRLFVKVCGAVAYLHKHGVVHRDLKPSNILVTDEGEPKLLDFGIAKMLVGNEHAPTTVLTQTGQRLLTPDYASPEQVRGASITEASDVYALGVLLYELLTARRPYRRRGRTLHQIERVILEDEPTRPSLAVTQPVVLDGGITDGPSRAAALRATTPPRLRQLLRGDIDAIILTALRKEPERRYHSADEFAADVCRHLDGLAVVARGDGVGYRVRKLLRRHRTLIAAGTIGVAAGIFFIVFLLAQTGMGSQEQGGFGAAPRVQPGATRRVAFTPALELDPELSPDGRMVAYVAPDSNDMMRIFVRSVDGGQSRMITAALDGYHRAPRWSPDGRRIAFQAKRQLWVVPADGSAPPTSFVKAEPYALSIAWSPDGREIAWSQGQSIYVRAVDGGEPRKLDATANWPHSLRWSPDGRWIAYVDDNYAFLYGAEAGGGPISLGNTAPSSIWLVPARPGGTHVRITHDRALNTTPAWLPESRGLLFVSNRDGDRDVYQLALGRDGRPAGAPVRVTAGLGVHSISVTPDGRRLAYAVFRNSANIWSVPILEDRVATEADLQPVTTGMQSIEGMSVSRDGQWLTFDSDRDGRQQIYKLPLTGGEPIRLTNAPTDDFIPAWSPDGKEIAYYSIDTTGRRIHVMSADGSVHRQIGPWPPGQRSPSWSPDGKRITFNASHLGASELFVATRLRDGWDRPVQITERNKGGGMARWSPTGNSIVYLREDGVWTASPDGGVPRLVVPIDPARRASLGAAEWSSDGRTIYYRWFDERWRTTIRAVPERGGPSREIMRLESPARQSRRGEMSCGAGRCYFTIAEHMGDVWTMELAGR